VRQRERQRERGGIGGFGHTGRRGIGCGIGGEAASGARRHRSRHLRRGGIGCGIGGKTASGAWRHRGLRLQRLKGDDNRERHWGRGGIGGFGGIGGGIGGEAASGAASGASFFGSFGMATRCENAGSPVPTGERADVRETRGGATTIYAICDYYLRRITCMVLVIMLMKMFSCQIPAGPDAEVQDFSNAPWQTGQNVSGEA